MAFLKGVLDVSYFGDMGKSRSVLDQEGEEILVRIHKHFGLSPGLFSKLHRDDYRGFQGCFSF